jgi:peptidoglycan/xylan/chitin deacetylase (PgdA/CDA1 family)
MDGLDAIYRGHGRAWSGRDAFYTSAVDNSLSVFGERGIEATYFVIASDLRNPEKAPAIRRVVDAGHRIACHGLDHLYLNRVDGATKRREIFDGKALIEDTLGVACDGFRAPGYSIDFESLELLRDAGYRYDSSIFPSHPFRKRLGVQRLFPDPVLFFP